MYQLNQIPSEAQIQKLLRQIVFGKRLRCPRCLGRQVKRSEERYRCKRCRRPFSVLSSTWLAELKLPLEQWYAVLWCWTQQIPVRQTQSLTRLSEEAVRRHFGRFRAHLPELEFILDGTIQLDEAYFKAQGLMLGKQIGTRKLAYQFVPGKDVNRTHAMRFLVASVAPESRLQTDGASIYQAIEQWWPVSHSTDIHRKFEFGLTSEIEGMFANLRTFIRRMYHHVTPEYLPAIVAEFCVRFSHPELFRNPRNYLKETLSPVPID